jgi:hypothetical protein
MCLIYFVIYRSNDPTLSETNKYLILRWTELRLNLEGVLAKYDKALASLLKIC